MESSVLSMLAIRIGLMGAGRMATALARGLVQAEMVPASAIVASDPSDEARQAFAREVPGANVAADNVANVAQADVVFLAVKPQQIGEALAALRGTLRADALVVSIAAGITFEADRRCAAGGAAHCAGDAQHAVPDRQGCERLQPGRACHARPTGNWSQRCFRPWARRSKFARNRLDAVTGLSGSGPAFVYSMIEALTEGGMAAGLPAELAAELAARTAAGAAEMVLQTGETPAVLRERVTSPGGTTVAGLAVLTERGFKDAVVEAVQAASAAKCRTGTSRPSEDVDLRCRFFVGLMISIFRCIG